MKSQNPCLGLGKVWSRNSHQHSKEQHKHSNAVLWYLIFGALHELSHWLIAVATCLHQEQPYYEIPWSSSLFQDTYDDKALSSVSFWYHLLVGRQFILTQDPFKAHEGDLQCHIWIIRHGGWMFSLILAIWVHFHFCNGRRWNSLTWAAWVTAMEAVWTDLFQWPTIPAFLGSTTVDHDLISFACGNFGVLLLHHAWWTTHRGKESALDVLEKMVYVTMMRGAQSGGVVCFHPQRGKKMKDENEILPQLRGSRTRVVNRKRTDLSLRLRRQVDRDNFGWMAKKAASETSSLVLAGHTRFATSSKATLDGTHPQQWTPPSPRQVYALQETESAQEPQTVNVEHFITHNGDLEFYRMQNQAYDVEHIQKWLEYVLQHPAPAPVDSAAIAGMMDLIRSRGCFGLSARYAVCLGLSTSGRIMDALDDHNNTFPSYAHFETVGAFFEGVLREMLKAATDNTSLLTSLEKSQAKRDSFARRVESKLWARREDLLAPLSRYILWTAKTGSDDGSQHVDDEEIDSGASIFRFCQVTINAFFDNDLLEATKLFLANAVGSFGLAVTSSLDANRQICLAARGQTLSVAFYPRKGMILYGSEQAAVKAGLKVRFPGTPERDLDCSLGDVDNDVLRLDLDDLNGEVLLLDFSSFSSKAASNAEASEPTNGHDNNERFIVSLPNRHLDHHVLMNGCVTGVLFHESQATTHDKQLYHRMTRLTRNPFVQPLPEDHPDLVLKDIQDIPKVCCSIQDDWHSDQAATSLNRLAAHSLSQALKHRLDNRINKSRSDNNQSVDLLVTGCEVSLWLAEAFAADLKRAFPKLNVVALSSNKILGVLGQDTAVPAFGFTTALSTPDLTDTIVLIVSHSGGTFAPLSCSNLLQSATRNIFAVTSEMDTQIGKQLRAMDLAHTENANLGDSSAGHNHHLHCSFRVFSTNVGVRPAEPCSVSVAATHQLLTNLFQYMAAVILSHPRYRQETGALMNEQDLQILERCNRDGLAALEEIVGVDINGDTVFNKDEVVEKELRKTGDLWANHVLEGARAYLMTFVYIFATVTSGYPPAFAIAHAWAGLDTFSDWIYVIHLVDAAIYFWLPQINILLLRLVQRRNLRHRMTARSVVIGDVPWVAQAAEAFLSKIFAVSYSIAGLNVWSGNPADHFVHRFTHRVVRGSLVIVGRPDGRLTSLSSAENSVCLSVNQASSIQSWGGTCESITIGHNPFQLPLSAQHIPLKRKRPLFLCERLLLEADVAAEQESAPPPDEPPSSPSFHTRMTRSWSSLNKKTKNQDKVYQDLSLSRGSSVRPKLHKRRSAAALLGTFRNLGEEQGQETELNGGDTRDDEEEGPQDLTLDAVVAAAIEDRRYADHTRKLFAAFDLDHNGVISEEEFLAGADRLQITSSSSSSSSTEQQLRNLFQLADQDGSGSLDYKEFFNLMENSAELMATIKLPPSHRDERTGLIQITPSCEKYFGELLRRYNTGKKHQTTPTDHPPSHDRPYLRDFTLDKRQRLAMELYEARIASLQRFVCLVVLFHQMGRRVERFFARLSFGFWSYRMDRTHSIMRIATTASPISGADVRDRMRELQLRQKVEHSIHVISMAWLRYKQQQQQQQTRTYQVETGQQQARHAAVVVAHHMEDRETEDENIRRNESLEQIVFLAQEESSENE